MLEPATDGHRHIPPRTALTNCTHGHRHIHEENELTDHRLNRRLRHADSPSSEIAATRWPASLSVEGIDVVTKHVNVKCVLL